MRRAILVGLSAAALITTGTGCENLPGSRGTQGAVIGGAAGAATGAAVSSNNRLIGALIGGAIGAGGGYLIGAHTDWFGKDDADDHARAAIRNAQLSPASPADVASATSADLNADGFVTMDELIAMEKAGLSDDQIIGRLRLTDQVFELTPSQRSQLVASGLSADVLDEMEQINRDEREEVLSRAR